MREARKKAYLALMAAAAGKAPTAKEIEERVKKDSMNLPSPNAAPVGPLSPYSYAASLFGQWIEYPPPPPKLAEELTIVEAVIGWRRWSVKMFGNQLFSNNGVEWKPFEKLVAECKKEGIFGKLSANNCSGLLCECGIYAYKDRFRARHGENAPKDVTHVWGEVYLWGRIVEHELGWRAQYAYPKSLVDSGGIARQVAREYGIGVVPETDEDRNEFSITDIKRAFRIPFHQGNILP